jgi:hypothetical protein
MGKTKAKVKAGTQPRDSDYETCLSLPAARIFGHQLTRPESHLTFGPPLILMIAGGGMVLGEPLFAWLAIFLTITMVVNSEGRRARVVPIIVAGVTSIGALSFVYYCLRHGISVSDRGLSGSDRGL